MPWYWPFKQSDDYSLERPTFIEGISDDTILLVIFTLSLIGLWIYYSTRERSTAIHPDNRQDVQVLRDRAQQDSSEGTRPTHVGRPRQDTCPICLTDSSVFSLETNCGHLFCGKCIITFWKYRVNWMNGMTCPVCRQAVTVLLTCFTADEAASTDNVDGQSVINDVIDFNRRFSGAPRSFREYLHDIPVLIPHILRQIFTVDTLSWAYRARILMIMFIVIGYVISPLDIIPESVLGLLGLFDDFFIIFCAALYIIIIYREYLSRH